jgi:hypothetical protein
MPSNDKPKTESKQIPEELKVQVMLAIYQTDIQTQTTIMFGVAALLFAIWAIYFSTSLLTNSLPAVVLFSFVFLLVMAISFLRYVERRKQLDNLRKKYCPDAYSVKS